MRALRQLIACALIIVGAWASQAPVWAALSTGLVAFWQLEEASELRADAHVNGLDLTAHGVPGNTGGKVGNAVALVASSSQYLSRAHTTLLQAADNDYSMACWVNLASKSGDMAILARSDVGSVGREYFLRYEAGADRFNFFSEFGGGTGNLSVNEAVIESPSTSTWYFVAGGHDADDNVIWVSVNAATPATAPTFGDPPNAYTMAFEVGRRDGASHFDGAIDQCGFWRRDIRADLAALYNEGDGLDYATLMSSVDAPSLQRLLLLGVS